MRAYWQALCLLMIGLMGGACTPGRVIHGRVPVTPAHPLVGPVVVKQSSASAAGVPFDSVEMCKGLGSFPEFLRRGDAESLWKDLVAQWRAVAPSSEMAFESAYAAAVRGFERDISRLLREKRQFKMLKRFLSYTREFGRLSRQSQELEFLTRGLIPEQPCHPAVYATLMNHWVRNLDPLAQVRLLPLRSETPEEPEEQESQYVLEIERSFGMAWVVDGQIPEADAELLLKRVLGSPAQNLTPLQWVWDLSRGQPSPELQRMLIDGLRGRRMVSWIWGDASELGPWKREWGTYYEATKVCELKSAQVSVVAACEPTRASRLEGQDPEQDLWLAVLSRERARRLDLTH